MEITRNNFHKHKGKTVWEVYEASAGSWKSITLSRKAIEGTDKLGTPMAKYPSGNVLPLFGRNAQMFTEKQEAIETAEKIVKRWSSEI